MSNSEKALQMHEQWNGKLETTAKAHVNSREDLAIAYTPGVAEPCKVIAKDPEAAYKYTIKSNTVAVVSDGSAVLASETSALLPQCLLWKERPYFSKNSAVSMQYRSVLIPKIQRRSSVLS